MIGRTTTDGELIDEMRRGVDGAVREFLSRFAPVLRGYAWRLGIDQGEAEIIIAEVLEDAALRLIDLPRTKRPESLAKYLVVTLRNRVVSWARAKLRGSAESRVEGGANPEDVSGCSESARREARGAWGEDDSRESSAVVGSLARALNESLTDEERRVLVWIGEAIPQREIARWLRISPVALRKRVERMRAKLRLVAAAHESALEPEDRMELRRFFDRCGFPLSETVNRPPTPADESMRERG